MWSVPRRRRESSHAVEMADAQLERAVDRPDRLVLVRVAVELGHAHAAETERGHLEVSQSAFFHLTYGTPMPAYVIASVSEAWDAEKLAEYRERNTDAVARH